MSHVAVSDAQMAAHKAALTEHVAAEKAAQSHHPGTAGYDPMAHQEAASRLAAAEATRRNLA